jgi:hypothetical protein
MNKRASNNKCYSLKRDLFEKEIMSLPASRFFPAPEGWSTGRYLYEECDEEKALPVVIIGRGKPRCFSCGSNKCTYVKGKSIIWRASEEVIIFSPAPLVIHSNVGEERFLDIAKCRKEPRYFLIESSPDRLKGSLNLQCVNCRSPELDIFADTFGFTTITCRHCGFIWLVDGTFPLEMIKKIILELARKLKLKLTYDLGFAKESQDSYLIRIKKDRA